MKYIFLVLAFLMFSGNARAVCSGGFDGANAAFEGCTEMGELGDLIYKRDNDGKVLGRRNEAEIKAYLISIVEDRLKGRGITMKNKKGQPSIKINEENIVFDLFNQNGELVFTYTVDLEKGVPENEKDLISSRESYKARKEENINFRKERLSELQALGDKIKAEEAAKKTAEKK